MEPSNEKSLPVKRQETLAAIFTDGFRNALAAIAPPTMSKTLSADRVMASLQLAMTKTPAIANCKPATIAQCAMQCVELGLLPGMPRSGWLIPFGTDCTLVISYQAMADLAVKSGACKSVSGYPVYENDEFDYEYGSTPRLVHRPVKLGRPKGKLVGVYARAELMAGGELFKVLDLDEVEKHRGRSRAKDSGPWKTDFDAMAMKTAVRILCNSLPQTPNLLMAMARDDEAYTYDHPVDVKIEQQNPGPMTPPRRSKVSKGEAPPVQEVKAEPTGEPGDEYALTDRQRKAYQQRMGTYPWLNDSQLAQMIKDVTDDDGYPIIEDLDKRIEDAKKK